MLNLQTKLFTVTKLNGWINTSRIIENTLSFESCLRLLCTLVSIRSLLLSHILCLLLLHNAGEKPFQCPVEGCGRSFTTSNIRKVHIRTHTGERPYYCSEPSCGRSFASATNYKNHMRIHTGESLEMSHCPLHFGADPVLLGLPLIFFWATRYLKYPKSPSDLLLIYFKSVLLVF